MLADIIRSFREKKMKKLEAENRDLEERLEMAKEENRRLEERWLEERNEASNERIEAMQDRIRTLKERNVAVWERIETTREEIRQMQEERNKGEVADVSAEMFRDEEKDRLLKEREEVIQ